MTVNGNTLIERYCEEGIRRVKLGICDVDGVLRGKYISIDKFAAIASGTSGFCDCVLGWDVDDQLYDNATITGWHTAFPDASYRLDLASERRLVEEGGVPFFLGQFVAADGEELHPVCPRSRLAAVLDEAAAMGFGVKLGFEYEFFVFRETAQSARDKGFRDLVPLSPGNFGYSVLRANTYAELFNAFMDYCVELDMAVEGLHCETGPGVWEAAIAADAAGLGADKAVLFKTFAKTFFQRREMLATFMAKWSMDYPGQSGHCHQSLTGPGDENLFYAPHADDGMSDLMRHYVAGVVTHLRELLAVYAPTINSYTRLVKGAWAPTAATWGLENRTCALRVIRGVNGQRMEFRIGSADANPYLVAAATIGSGLKGIRDRLELSEPVRGNAYEQQDKLPAAMQLPGSLKEATADFVASEAAREIFGDTFVEHYAASRDWEVREYERHVNDWQLERYFEII
jgi:glutamine synthetase